MLAKIFYYALLLGITAGSQFYKEVEDYKSQPQPYKFGYEVKDKESAQYRHEESDGSGNVKGSYGYTDDNGIYREVHYIADKNGFRADVKTNEPGTANQNPAHVQIKADPKYVEVVPQKKIPNLFVPNILVPTKVQVVPEQKFIVKNYEDLSIPKYKKYQLLKNFDLSSQPEESFFKFDQPLEGFTNINQPLEAFSSINKPFDGFIKIDRPLDGFSYNTENMKSFNYMGNKLNGANFGKKPAYNFNISPLSGFNYQPLSKYENYQSYKPLNQQKKYKFRVPLYRNRYGLEGQQPGMNVLENGRRNDYEKIKEEIKKIANYGLYNNAASFLGSQVGLNRDFASPQGSFGQLQFSELSGGYPENSFDNMPL